LEIVVKGPRGNFLPGSVRCQKVQKVQGEAAGAETIQSVPRVSIIWTGKENFQQAEFVKKTAAATPLIIYNCKPNNLLSAEESKFYC